MPSLPPCCSPWALSPPLRAWSCGGLLALLLLASPVRSATAQVPLQLLHRVDSTRQNAFEGSPLPPQTRVVLLRHPAKRPHTLENTGIPRKELARLVLTRLRSRDTPIRLGEEGRTRRRYASTDRSNRVLYVLARTPDSTLYESYVNTGDGFAPGFDAVRSGRMTMGPVTPREARRRFRAVFRLHRDSTVSASHPTSGTESSGPSKTRTGPQTEARMSDSSSARTAASQDASPKPASPSESEGDGSPAWTFLLGGVIGGLIGGGVAWWIFSERLRGAEEDRADLRRKLRGRKNQEFRKATGTTLSGSSKRDGTPFANTSSSGDLERLREENETLKRRIEKIKKHLQNLRDAGD